MLELVFPKELNVDLGEKIRSLGLEEKYKLSSMGWNLKGEVSYVTDAETMSKLDLSRYQKPGLEKTNAVKYDIMKIKKLDKYQMKHNLYIKYKLDEKTYVLPIESELNFLAALRRGIGSKHGPNQEFAGEMLDPFRIELKPCIDLKTLKAVQDDEIKNDD